VWSIRIDGLIVSVSWVCFVGYWLIASRHTKRTVGRTIGGPTVGLRVLATLAVAVLATSGALGGRGPHTPAAVDEALGAAGAALCAGGIAFAIWARAQLGRNWGMPGSITADPELITTGPYSVVRHPIYTGVVAAMAGSALVHGMAWWILAIAFLVYFLISASAEEREMQRRFPDRYPEYRSNTKRLIPYVV
jgi:protein-S-isoprenylcysteine O-methyltransferase Ste14